MAKLPAAQVRIGKGVEPGRSPVVHGQPCANPTCGFPAANAHHITRRSHLGGPYEKVEIDGLVWPNVTALCFSCHQDVEEMRAHIVLPTKDSPLPYVYHWVSDGESHLLGGVVSEPGPLPELDGTPQQDNLGGSPVARESGTPYCEGGTDTCMDCRGSCGIEEYERDTRSEGAKRAKPVEARGHELAQRDSTAPRLEPTPSDSPVAEGEKCPTCLRKRPHSKKKESPKSKVMSLRVPLDEHEALVNTLEACENHLATHSQPFSAFKTISVALALLLQDESLKGFGERKAA